MAGSGFKSFVKRVDRGIGVIVWPLVTLFFASLSVLSLVGVYGALTAGEGPGRWAVLCLALACSVLFGAGARKASKKRNASEWLDEV